MNDIMKDIKQRKLFIKKLILAIYEELMYHLTKEMFMLINDQFVVSSKIHTYNIFPYIKAN